MLLLRSIPLYLSEEMRIEHHKMIMEHHKAMKRWRIKRTAFMVVPHMFGLGILSAPCSIHIWYNLPVARLPSLYIAGAVLSHYATRNFGVLSVNFFYFLGLYSAAFLGAVVLKRFAIINITSSGIDVIEFGLCLLLGLYISSRKYEDTMGDLLRMPFWGRVCRMYQISFSTTSVVIVFTYGALEIIEYIINNVSLITHY